MRETLLALLILCSLGLPAVAGAKVVNVEFNFTPYTGDAKADKVRSVAGMTTVSMNGVFVAQQAIEQGDLPVLFETREIAPAVWIPVESLGSILRKGKNTLRIEFAPTSETVPYKARLRWAAVTDEVREEKAPGGKRATNQADAGRDEKEATGRVVMEREFVADFAKPQAWHAYPPVVSITSDDERKLAALVAERPAWFKPDFAKMYALIASNERLDVDEVKEARCLDAAYAAGVRLRAAPEAQLEFSTTGGPEVVVRRRDGLLFETERAAFERIAGGEEMQMCAGMALSVVFPARLVAVRRPDGTWEALP
ncbi:MAG: hypothetical protein KIT14_01140 [bacterium]|nr:hypothetical protein [bacterium]